MKTINSRTMGNAIPACILTALVLLGLAGAAFAADVPIPKVRGNVVQQFNSLRISGDLIGFNIGDAPDTGYLTTSATGDKEQTECHWQGIARHPDPSTRIFYLSRSAPDDADGSSAYEKGTIVAVLIDSADVSTGDRIRSNLLQQDTDAIDTTPWSTDRVIWKFEVDDYKHAGSMQIVGNYLVVTMSEPFGGRTVPDTSVLIFDITNPRSPESLGYFPANCYAGTMGITRLADGRYLMAQGNLFNNEYVLFTLSANADIRTLANSTNQFPWYPTNHPTVPWPVIEQTNSFGFFDPPPGVATKLAIVQQDPKLAYYSFQAINLIQSEDGGLFMIGTMNPNGTSPSVWGGLSSTPDLAALYAVNVVTNSLGNLTNVELHLLSVKHFTIPDTFLVYPASVLAIDFEQEVTDFNAGGGVYVSPAGDLFLYSSSHYNRYKDIFQVHHTKPTFISQYAPGEDSSISNSPFVVLYEDDSFQGRSITFDGLDSILEDWSDLSKIEGFGDRTTSLIYRLPLGTSLSLYEDMDFGGRQVTLTGTGTTVLVNNVNNLQWTTGGNDLNDKISSLKVTPITGVAMFVSDERSGASGVFTDFAAPYGLLPFTGPGSIINIQGERTITLGSGASVLRNPGRIRAFGGSVVFQK